MDLKVSFHVKVGSAFFIVIYRILQLERERERERNREIKRD
jgi:hypothetical protein